MWRRILTAMNRKTVTIVSLIGLLLSMGLWIGAEFKIRRLNARFHQSRIQVVTISGIDQETGEALRVAVGSTTPRLTYSPADDTEGVTLQWFDPQPFEINVSADGYETQRIELDYSSPRHIEVVLRPIE